MDVREIEEIFMLECLSFISIIVVSLILLEVKYKYVSKNKKEVIMIVGLGTLAFLIFFKSIIFEGYQLSFSNLIYAVSPFKELEVEWTGPFLSDPIDECLPWIYQIFVEHNLLLWSSSTMFGTPILLAKFILNPSNIGYLLGMEFGQTFQFIVKYSAAFIGMYLYLKNVKMSKYAAYAGAITYTFASVIVMWGGWPHSDVIALAPFLFYAVDKLIVLYKEKSAENKVKYYLLFIVMLYIMLIVGMPTYVVYYLYLGIVYTIYRLLTHYELKHDYKVMGFILLTIGVAIIIAAILSLPYIGELYGQVDEYTEVRAGYAFYSLEWEYIRGFLFPYATNTGTSHMNECSVYIGIMFIYSLVLTPLYFKQLDKKSKKDVIFWASTFILMFVFVFTEWSGYIYQYVPLIDSSCKYRLIVLMNFAGAIFVAWTINHMIAYKGKKLGAIVLLIPALVFGLFHEFLVIEEQQYVLVLLVILAILIIAYMFVKKHKWQKVIMIIILVTMTLDSAYFASCYLPLIEDDVVAIPESTESIAYLQNETDNGERVVPLGKWILFPMSNTFYDIDTIAGHGFINTNEDMANYLTLIDEEAYDSYTRTSIKNIESYSLLSYAAVKYLYYENKESDLVVLQEILNEYGVTRYPVRYDGSYVVSQAFELQEEQCNYIGILFSTYGVELSELDILEISIYNDEQELVYTEEVPLSDIVNEDFYGVSLGDTMLEGVGETYYLELKGNHIFENPIALWITTDSIYEGEFDYDETSGDLSFVMQQIATEDDLVLDDMVIMELEEYSERAFVATDFVVTETLAESLELMSQEYLENTAFITEDIYNKYNFITETEQVLGENQVISYEDFDDEVYMTVQTTGSNMLVLTDYYYDGWKAYIDGEEVEIEKVNYLFRGIYLEEAGEHEIVFKYLPTSIIIEWWIYGIMVVTLIGVWVCKKKVNEYLGTSYEKAKLRD